MPARPLPMVLEVENPKIEFNTVLVQSQGHYPILDNVNDPAVLINEIRQLKIEKKAIEAALCAEKSVRKQAEKVSWQQANLLTCASAACLLKQWLLRSVCIPPNKYLLDRGWENCVFFMLSCPKCECLLPSFWFMARSAV